VQIELNYFSKDSGLYINGRALTIGIHTKTMCPEAQLLLMQFRYNYYVAYYISREGFNRSTTIEDLPWQAGLR